jgi:predicted DNA-binding WGR domain protein
MTATCPPEPWRRGIILHRIDDGKNMRRFYRLDVQRQWCFIREWGRIGRAGQVRTILYDTAAEAHDALAWQRRMKGAQGVSLPVTPTLASCS